MATVNMTLLVASTIVLAIASGVLGWKVAFYWYIERPLKRACDLCGWMPGAGHAPNCPRWKPKEGEMEHLAEQMVERMQKG